MILSPVREIHGRVLTVCNSAHTDTPDDGLFRTRFLENYVYGLRVLQKLCPERILSRSAARRVYLDNNIVHRSFNAGASSFSRRMSWASFFFFHYYQLLYFLPPTGNKCRLNSGACHLENVAQILSLVHVGCWTPYHCI